MTEGKRILKNLELNSLRQIIKSQKKAITVSQQASLENNNDDDDNNNS